MPDAVSTSEECPFAMKFLLHDRLLLYTNLLVITRIVVVTHYSG